MDSERISAVYVNQKAVISEEAIDYGLEMSAIIELETGLSPVDSLRIHGGGILISFQKVDSSFSISYRHEQV